MLIDEISKRPYDFEESIRRVHSFRKKLATIKRKEPEPEPEPKPEPEQKKPKLVWKRKRDILLLASRPNQEAEELVLQQMERPGSMSNILAEVCTKTGFSVLEIRSKRRSIPLVAARHEIMYRCSHETPASLPMIGRFLGGKHHTTVLHGIRKWEREWVRNDYPYREKR